MLVFPVRETPNQHRDIGVLMLHYQVESDSTGGATSNSKVHELGYYRHVHYTLALMCANSRIIIFCSLLDIWENVLLDIRENVEWPHFFGPPCRPPMENHGPATPLPAVQVTQSCSSSSINSGKPLRQSVA